MRHVFYYLLMIILFTVILSAHLNADETNIDDGDASSEKSSKFEWGPSLLCLRMNHYRGSDQYMNKVIPFPYFSYTSEHLEAEPSYVRGTLFENSFFSLKISVMAGLSVDSTRNRARKDMPDLDYMIEIGPMLILKLWKSENNLHEITFESPFRRVFSTDFTRIDQVGWWSVPYINYIIYPNKYTLDTRCELSFAAMFADNGYHDYFYRVDREYASVDREEYNPTGGYSGVQFAMVMEKRIGNVILIPVFRYDYLKETVFEESPLVKTKSYFAFLLAGIYLVR